MVAQSRGVRFIKSVVGEIWEPEAGALDKANLALQDVALGLEFPDTEAYNTACELSPEIVRARLDAWKPTP